MNPQRIRVRKKNGSFSMYRYYLKELIVFGGTASSLIKTRNSANHYRAGYDSYDTNGQQAG